MSLGRYSACLYGRALQSGGGGVKKKKMASIPSLPPACPFSPSTSHVLYTMPVSSDIYVISLYLSRRQEERWR